VTAGDDWGSVATISEHIRNGEKPELVGFPAELLFDIKIRALPNPVFAAELAVLNDGEVEQRPKRRLKGMIRTKELPKNRPRGAQPVAASD